MDLTYDEIHVYESVAERTGQKTDRSGVRGRRGVCRSLTELAAKSRRMGDGYYYLASVAWPDDTPSVNLARTWEPLA